MPQRKPANRTALTQLFIEKTKPGKEAINFWDLKAPGLCWRLQKSSHSAFFFVYARHGKPCWYFIGSGVPLADARRISLRLRVELANGRDPLAERRAERGSVTFEELADRYLNEYAKRRNKSWPQARAQVEKYLLPKWKTLPAKVVTRADARNLIAKVTSPSVANLVWAAGSAIFTWGVKQEIVSTNPFVGIERNKMQS